MKKLQISEFNENIFELFNDQWALLTAGTIHHFNTMTISWGMMGILWNKKIVSVFVRPTRYTYQFMEEQDTFTLSFYEEKFREALFVLGSNSGKDTNKVELSGLTPMVLYGNVTFEEHQMTIVCKKIYTSDLNPSHFLEQSIGKNYPNLDYHRQYMGEIIGIYVK